MSPEKKPVKHASATDIERIVPIKEEAEKIFLSIPGVTGVDIDLKLIGGDITDIPSIHVYVAKKGIYASEHAIPSAFDGVPTDVVEMTFSHTSGAVSKVEPFVNSQRYNPCQPGANVSAWRDTTNYGTLGVIVEDLDNHKQSAWLGCFHIFCMDDTWPADKRLTQPAHGYPNVSANDVIGSVIRGEYGLVQMPGDPPSYVDAAIATISGRAVDEIPIGLFHQQRVKGGVNSVVGTDVQKYGATTGGTSGTITSTDLTIVFGTTTFRKQVKVGGPFCDGGDSGAPVVEWDDEDFNYWLVGMVIGKGNGPLAPCGVVTPWDQIARALHIGMPPA
jgi:hypothetical protein